MLFEYLSDTERTKIKPLNYRIKSVWEHMSEIYHEKPLLPWHLLWSHLPSMLCGPFNPKGCACISRSCVTLHINRQINFDTSKYFDCGQSFLFWELLTLSNLTSRHWQCPPTEPLSLHRNKTEFVFCFGRIVKLTSTCFFNATTAKLYLLTA